MGWQAHPAETMRRASHAVATAGGVWVVDPLDVDGLDELLAEFGDVAGVAVLLDRHLRDADAVAARHDVAVYVPDMMTDLDAKLDAPVHSLQDGLADSGYAVREIIDNRLWREAVLYSAETGQLIVPEALGTAGYFIAGGERLGVHPALRLRPPRRLGSFAPERVDLGHGRGISTDAEATVKQAVRHSRRGAPRLYAATVKEFLLP